MDNNENSRLSAIEAILERSAIEAECRNVEFERRSGIAIIKQVGDTVLINDGHLKVF